MSVIMRSLSGQYVLSSRPRILIFSNYHSFKSSNSSVSEWCKLFDFEIDEFSAAVDMIETDGPIKNAYQEWGEDEEN